ncbi:MAG: hypothetical protein ACRDH5_00800 [bacterium]
MAPVVKRQAIKTSSTNGSRRSTSFNFAPTSINRLRRLALVTGRSHATIIAVLVEELHQGFQLGRPGVIERAAARLQAPGKQRYEQGARLVVPKFERGTRRKTVPYYFEPHVIEQLGELAERIGLSATKLVEGLLGDLAVFLKLDPDGGGGGDPEGHGGGGGRFFEGLRRLVDIKGTMRGPSAPS